MKSKVMLSVLMLTCMALNVNLAWGAEGESHQWTTYSEWGVSATSWLRNNNATLPTLKYTPTYAVSKVVLNVKQSNSTGSNSIEVTIGGKSFGTTVSSLSGTTAYDITFEETTAMSGEVVITCTNKSGFGTGKGTFYLNSITLYESGVTYTDVFMRSRGSRCGGWHNGSTAPCSAFCFTFHCMSKNTRASRSSAKAPLFGSLMVHIVLTDTKKQ